MSNKIRVAIIGVGNCASSLVQGLSYYRDRIETDRPSGVIHYDIGGYSPTDIEVVEAFDIDTRKINTRLTQAIFQKPNNTLVFNNTFPEDFSDPVVSPAPVLDGYSDHMANFPDDQTFLPYNKYGRGMVSDVNYDEWKERIVAQLKRSRVDVLINYLPVGSQKATEFWAEVALAAKVSFVNCIPVFIASSNKWAKRFVDARIPIIGDDMRSCVGASIISAVLQELFLSRGAEVLMHYQDNIGGNTDFLNMQNPARLQSKKTSKENVIINQSLLNGSEVAPYTIKAGPAAYFPALKDNKRAHFNIKAKSWGGAPIEFTAELSVEDSPNSAAVVCDAVRLVHVARKLNIVGPIVGASAWTQKTPPFDLSTAAAKKECNELAQGKIPQTYRLMRELDGEFYSYSGSNDRTVSNMGD